MQRRKKPAAGLLLVALCLAAGMTTVMAETYFVSASGQAPAKSPKDWGLAFSMGNEESNTLQMLSYLKPTYLRIFIQPLSGLKWRSFVSNNGRAEGQYSSQYGLDFSGNSVTTAEQYKAAVANLRDSARTQSFFDWLTNRKEVDWARLLTRLSTTEPGVTGAYGNPDRYIKDVQSAGYDILAMWDVRCNSFDLNTTDATNPEYYKERWELYRINYFGGRWFAERKITQIELYNEPDKNPGCMEPAKWEDDVRIRSQALQDAFADHNSVKSTDLVPRLIGPTLAVYWRTSYSEPMFRLMHTPFPDNVEDRSFTLFHGYSFHKYGDFSPKSCDRLSASCRNEASSGMRSNYNNAKQKLAEIGYPDMEVMITEFNCFTAADSDSATHAYFLGKNVADMPATAACIGSQIAHLIKTPGGPSSINVHRLTQSYSPQFPSKITKNGIMFGSVNENPFFLTGTTKSGEVYSLIRRKSGREAPIWEFTCNNRNIVTGRVTIWAVDDFYAYYVYVTNEEWRTHRVILDLNSLPGVNPWSNVVATAVGLNREMDSTYHGEVAWMNVLGENKTVNMVLPQSTFYMLTVPKMPTAQLAVRAAGDATVRADGQRVGLDPILQVSTAEDLSVVLLKFRPEGQVPKDLIVTAVLQLHLREATNDDPQVMTVLGLPDDWHEEGVGWDNLIFLKSAPAKVTKTTENFINWWSKPQPEVLGHVTIPPRSRVQYGTGTLLRLDVTDAVKRGIYEFMLVRIWRFDESKGEGPSKLPADNVQGTYFFTSKDDTNADPSLYPTLLVDYQVPEGFAPPPPLTPPPPPESPPPPASPPPPPPPSPLTPPTSVGIRQRSPPLINIADNLGKRKSPPPKAGGKKRPPPPGRKKKPPPPSRKKKSPPPAVNLG